MERDPILIFRRNPSAGLKTQRRSNEMNATNEELKKIPLGNIRANPNNSRRAVRGPGFESFVESIRAQGQMQPGVARPHPTEPDAVELLCGHRRFAALQDIGAATMNLVIREATDQQALLVLASENLQREDLTHLEEAEDVRKLLSSGMNHKELAAELGKSLAWVYRRDRLNELHADLRVQACDPSSALGGVSVEYLEEIAAFPLDVQARWANTGPWTRGWYVPTLEKLKIWIGNEMKLLARAPFDVQAAGLVPSIGACTLCPKRSSCSAGVFGLQDLEPGEVGKRDQCLDGACWNAKVLAFRDNKLKSVLEEKPRIRLLVPQGGGVTGNEKARFKGLVESWDWRPAKKNTPGAVEGFILFGDEVGKVVWAKIDGEEGRVQTATPKGEEAKELTPKEKAKALAHNRQVLDNRRTALALQSLADHLRGVHNLAALAACLDLKSAAALGLMFGWDQKCKAEAEWNGEGLLKMLARREADVSPKDLFIVVLDPMVQRLFVMKTTEANDRQVAHAEFFCELFNLDWKGFLAKAAEEIKEPKSWAALEAPGPTAVEQLAERAGKSRSEKPGKAKESKVGPVKESAGAGPGSLGGAKPKGKAKPSPKEKRARPGLQLQDKAPAAKPKAAGKKGGAK